MATQELTPHAFAVLSSEPSSPQNGWAYYDTTLNTLRIYQNNNWVNIPNSFATMMKFAID